jgi:hypothetical protein
MGYQPGVRRYLAGSHSAAPELQLPLGTPASFMQVNRMSRCHERRTRTPPCYTLLIHVFNRYKYSKITIESNQAVSLIFRDSPARHGTASSEKCASDEEAQTERPAESNPEPKERTSTAAARRTVKHDQQADPRGADERGRADRFHRVQPVYECVASGHVLCCARDNGTVGISCPTRRPRTGRDVPAGSGPMPASVPEATANTRGTTQERSPCCLP